MPNESFRYTKQISDQGRERSVEVRRERATLKRRLKAAEISPADVLNDEGNVAHWAFPIRRQFAPWVPCRRPAY